ncbi:fumarylacetoacetate hydrolase family protein, partial [Rhizobium leguminosarum]|uniref:fumarylacetoacetate hydrolase family protein n=1 Tax=Rhizobium leguminosarum TaxID=384 RepID=UPI003F957C3C
YPIMANMVATVRILGSDIDRARAIQTKATEMLALKSGGANIEAADALDCVYGYAVGIDFTRRDLQGEAKKLGRPREVGKAFEHSAPI